MKTKGGGYVAMVVYIRAKIEYFIVDISDGKDQSLSVKGRELWHKIPEFKVLYIIYLLMQKISPEFFSSGDINFDTIAPIFHLNDFPLQQLLGKYFLYWLVSAQFLRNVKIYML